MKNKFLKKFRDINKKISIVYRRKMNFLKYRNEKQTFNKV